MSTAVGIKLADGSFYPILYKDASEKKLLELTTVNDGQTTVQIDLYRSQTGSMEDAEYIDTLKIEGLVPHPSGEPSLHLDVSLDEDKTLSAEVLDPETGQKQNVSVSMIMRSEAERELPPDFTLSERSPAVIPIPPVEQNNTAENTWDRDLQVETDSADPLNQKLDEEELPDFSEDDFVVPDFEKNNTLNIGNLLEDAEFDLPSPQRDEFADAAPPFIHAANSETGSFEGLFDDPSHYEKKDKSQVGFTVVCIICAIICLAALAGIFLLVPSRFALPPQQQTAAVSEPESQESDPALRYPPRENEIVVAPTPDIAPRPVPQPETPAQEGVQYRIKWGDTLWDLAAAYYKNPWRYPEIAQANNIANPDYIISGTYIIIPVR